MSYLLDAIKKSESDSQGKPKTSPDLLTEQASPVYLSELSDEIKPKRDFFKPIAISAIFILALALAFLLGREFALGGNKLFSFGQDNPLASLESHNVVSPKTAANVVAPQSVQAHVTTPQLSSNKVAAPSAVNKASNPTVKLASSGEMQAESNAFNLDAAEFNQRSFDRVTPKKNSGAELNQPITKPVDEGVKLTGSKIDDVEVSSNLLKRFEKAIAETEDLSDTQIYQLQRADLVEPLVDMPLAVQDKVPPLVFQTHIYSSVAKDRWVKVNDEVLHEGQYITDDLKIAEIQPQLIILEQDGLEFSLPALSDW